MKFFMKKMEDMNQSSELLERKPHLLITVFIYTLLALLVLALAWSCFSEVDDFIRVSGVVLSTEDGSYRVQLSVPDRYLGVVKVGVGVKYRFSGLPGEKELPGKVTRVNTGTRFYPGNGPDLAVIEASIDAGFETVKPGILCEAQVGTGSRKTLYYLLDKLGFTNK